MVLNHRPSCHQIAESQALSTMSEHAGRLPSAAALQAETSRPYQKYPQLSVIWALAAEMGTCVRDYEGKHARKVKFSVLSASIAEEGSSKVFVVQENKARRLNPASVNNYLAVK